jgi:hypothetical protein
VYFIVFLVKRYSPAQAMNHIHGIIQITSAVSDSPNTRIDMESIPTEATIAKIDVPRIVQAFKRHTTIKYIKMVKQNI